jgi:hypothetical protein
MIVGRILRRAPTTFSMIHGTLDGRSLARIGVSDPMAVGPPPLPAVLSRHLRERLHGGLAPHEVEPGQVERERIAQHEREWVMRLGPGYRRPRSPVGERLMQPHSRTPAPQHRSAILMPPRPDPARAARAPRRRYRDWSSVPWPDLPQPQPALTRALAAHRAIRSRLVALCLRERLIGVQHVLHTAFPLTRSAMQSPRPAYFQHPRHQPRPPASAIARCGAGPSSTPTSSRGYRSLTPRITWRLLSGVPHSDAPGRRLTQLAQ